MPVRPILILSIYVGLPTLSTSFGEEGEIREWRDLSPEQENYLIQIRPPADMATGVIRQLISRQNITNAAILFDKNFGKHMMYHFFQKKDMEYHFEIKYQEIGQKHFCKILQY